MPSLKKSKQLQFKQIVIELLIRQKVTCLRRYKSRFNLMLKEYKINGYLNSLFSTTA